MVDVLLGIIFLIQAIKGSGPGGRITVTDVENAAAAKAPSAPQVAVSPAAGIPASPPPRVVVTEGRFKVQIQLLYE